MGKLVKLLIATTLLLSSCIKDDVVVEFNQKPTLLLDFNYTSAEGISTTDIEVDNIQLFLYSPTTQYLTTHYISKSEVIAHNGFVALSGVEPNNYYVLSVANMTNSVVDTSYQVESLSDFSLALPSSKTLTSCDSLFMSLDTLTVDWGNPYAPINTIELNKKFYKLNTTITGAKRLDAPNSAVTMQVVNVPSGFNYQGLFSDSESVINPPLTFSLVDDMATSTTVLNEFTYKHDVYIEIFDADELVDKINLTSKMLDDNIDFSAKDIEINLTINLTTLSNSLVIDDWYISNEQEHSIGK